MLAQAIPFLLIHLPWCSPPCTCEPRVPVQWPWVPPPCGLQALDSSRCPWHAPDLCSHLSGTSRDQWGHKQASSWPTATAVLRSHWGQRHCKCRNGRISRSLAKGGINQSTNQCQEEIKGLPVRIHTGTCMLPSLSKEAGFSPLLPIADTALKYICKIPGHPATVPEILGLVPTGAVEAVSYKTKQFERMAKKPPRNKTRGEGETDASDDFSWA